MNSPDSPGDPTSSKLIQRIIFGSICVLFVASILILRSILGDSGRFNELFRYFLAFYSLAFLCSVCAAVKAAGMDRFTIVCAVLLGIVVRFAFITQEPVLSDDIYRYYWDGRLAAVGVNPFAQPPAAESLEEYRDSYWKLVAHKKVRTIYPPVAQAFFAACYKIRPGVTSIKFALVMADIALIGALACLLAELGKPVRLVLLYAMSPLAILETSHSGHVDALGALLLVVALIFALKSKWIRAGIFCGLSAATKVVGGVAAVFFISRRKWKAAVICALVFLITFIPFIGAGRLLFSGFNSFTGRFFFNAPLVGFVEWSTVKNFPDISTSANLLIMRKVIIALGAAMVLGVAIYQARKGRCLVHGVRVTVGALLLFSPVLYPWYVIWVLPLAIATLSPAWIVFSWVSVLSYFANVNAVKTGQWFVPIWVMAIEFGALLLVALWSYIRYRQKQNPAGP